MDERLERLYSIARQELLEDILPYWMNKAVDEENGGFCGALEASGVPVPDSPKCLILNARILWTFSAAYRIFRDGKYKAMADRAYRYFTDFFIDREYGGCFYQLNARGQVLDGKKLVYGNAFAIYALSEYARAMVRKRFPGRKRLCFCWKITPGTRKTAGISSSSDATGRVCRRTAA